MPVSHAHKLASWDELNTSFLIAVSSPLSPLILLPSHPSSPQKSRTRSSTRRRRILLALETQIRSESGDEEETAPK